MKAYLIADITVEDPETFKLYREKVPAIIEKHQGRYLVRGSECERAEGHWQPQRMVIIEFPTRKQALAFLQDPDYQPVAALRHASASSNLVIVDGYQ